ncbi:hypothetical protein BDV25DRAFT_139358 [Aspergillus avenaceus]|uniref:Carrier domain-containing protein n=1 Tax=Aspergillus avenaceus TaxID=36643 RepID=A0A5N6TX12_ASPAV|nr:hypothetical protein BDV25DRAFT_139358 [Aspergillus avenaceus]
MACVGNRLLPEVVRRNAQIDPEGIFAHILEDNQCPTQWTSITKRQLAVAVDAAAWWITNTLTGKADSKVVAYMGASDIRYVICTIALSKAGYKAFLPSPRNSSEANSRLFESVGCVCLLWGGDASMPVLEQGIPGLRVWEFPLLEDLVRSSTPVYPYRKSFDNVEGETFVIMHTSGTTGYPKPVALSHGWFSVQDRAQPADAPDDVVYGWWNAIKEGDKMFTLAPFFHALGFALAVEAVFHGKELVFYSSTPDVNSVVDALLVTCPRVAIFPPAVLESLSQSMNGLDALSAIEYVFYGGGPLSTAAGDSISQRTQLIPALGSTEVGHIPTFKPKVSWNWKYFEWPKYYNVCMRPHDEKNYELVIRRTVRSREIHAVFHLFPDLREWGTKDLFSKHPTEEGLWRFEGRVDDVIVMANGEKVTPVEMESTIERHPLVHKALISGQGMSQCVLLVEPKREQWHRNDQPGSFIDDIWPHVISANELAPSHAFIEKHKIGIASRDKPFRVATKGVLQRGNVCHDYAAEIAALGESANQEKTDTLANYVQKGDLISYVREVVASIAPKLELSDETEFFAAGIDSLQVVRMAGRISRDLKAILTDSHGMQISPQIIYGYSTMKSLAAYLSTVVIGKTNTGDLCHSSGDMKYMMDRMVDKYTKSIPALHRDYDLHGEGNTILLTGSTGSFGSYLLDVFLRNPSIRKVYCLNSSPDALHKQMLSFEERDLNVEALSRARVEFLATTLEDEQLGLSRDKYEEISDAIDAIVHNAWKVDFNLPVQSFTNHIEGTRNLASLSLYSRKKAHMYFVSSVAAISGLEPLQNKVPETPLLGKPGPSGQGYAQSKHVAEQICLSASLRSGMPCTILRIGQIAGPMTKSCGRWNRNEWLPSLIITSKSMGMIPESLDMPVDWIPIDILAQVVSDIVHSETNNDSRGPATLVHLKNPHLTDWCNLLPIIQKRTGAKPVSLERWIDELQETDAVDIENRPALKLLSFYKQLVDHATEYSTPLEIHNASKVSPAFCNLRPVDANMMGAWLSQWGL